MRYLRLIKYPGAKASLIPDIENTFRNSGHIRFIDVFGGSGLVSLNIEATETVYNDTNPELYNLFWSIRKHGNELQDVFQDFLYYVQDHSKKQRFEYYNRYVAENGKEALKAVLDSNGILFKPEGEPMGNAMRTILKFSTGFGGMGNTYRTKREKSVFRFLQKSFSDLSEISRRVSTWRIENKDFRELVKRYDGKDAFFYFDPPYAGKKWYGDNFGKDDFSDLASILDRMKGNYLMNLDSDQELLLDIFGDPAFVKGYSNQNTGRQSDSLRKRAFYTNVTR